MAFAAACLFARAGHAKAAFQDDFENGEVDLAVWDLEQTGPIELTESGGVLRASTPGGERGRAAVTLRAKAEGDFYITVDYRAAAYTGTADGRHYLVVQGPSSYAAVYYHRFGARHREIVFAGTLGGGPEIYAYETAVSDAGKLCIRRAGATIMAFYGDGQRWKVLASRPGFVEDTAVRVRVESTAAFPALAFDADNFRIEADRLVSALAVATHTQGVKRYTSRGDYALSLAVDGAFGDVTYQWLFHDGSKTVPVGTGPSYTIAQPAADDSGQYSCLVRDRVKEAMSNKAEVRFAPPLAFTEHPQGAALYTGETGHTMKVATAGGMGRTACEWLFDDGSGPVPAGRGATHEILAPTPAHSGRYWCAAKDEIAAVWSNTAVLQVADHVAFTAQPAGVERYVDEGEAALSVATTGALGDVVYQWMFDNGAGPAAVATGSTFTIAAPKPENSGKYWCEVSDTRETVTSEPAALVIAQHLALETQPQGAERYVDEGEVALSVAATGGLGDVAYQWMFDNGAGAAAVGPGPTFTIAAPKPENSGRYWCEASDKRETVTSEPAALLVAEHLALQTQPAGAERYVDEGEVALSVATTGGLGDVAYQWMFDSGAGPAAVGTGPTLTIAAPRPENSGKYWCDVSDKHETVTSESAAVVVAEHLALQTQPAGAEQYVDKGEITLSVATTGGLGDVAYQWQFDSGAGPAAVGTGATYTLAAPAPSHSGVYWCEASDARETVTSNTAALKVVAR